MAKTEGHAFTSLLQNGEILEFDDIINLIDSILTSSGYPVDSNQLDISALDDNQLFDALAIEASTPTSCAELWRNSSKGASSCQALGQEKVTGSSILDGSRTGTKRKRDEVDGDALEDAPPSKRRRLKGSELTQVGVSVGVDRVRMLKKSRGEQLARRDLKVVKKVGIKAGKGPVKTAGRTETGKPATSKVSKPTIKKVTWTTVQVPTCSFQLPQDRYM